MDPLQNLVRRLATVAVAVAMGWMSRPATADDQRTGPTARESAPKFHVVGYLPEYRIADIDPGIGEHLTDLICFSAEADSDGGLKLGRLKPEHLRKLGAIKERHPLALLLCVGGWERSREFPKLASSPAARQKFTNALTAFCRENRFDGADLDWEHPANESEYRDYATLLGEIKRAFEPDRLTLTIAVAGWQVLPTDAVMAVDRVHLMAYDAEGKHSTDEFAEADVARLLKRGVPPEKIALGLPFYGREVKSRTRELAYSQIVKKFNPNEDVDEVDGIYFNGLATIKRKTRFAMSRKLGGVMAWEIGQDVAGERSLLRAVRRTVDGERVK